VRLDAELRREAEPTFDILLLLVLMDQSDNKNRQYYPVLSGYSFFIPGCDNIQKEMTV
jgi:hypothetical protein